MTYNSSRIDFDWNRDYRGNLKWLPQNTILLSVHGSHAYGLATEESDIDIKGIAIPPQEYFLGFLRRFDQAESKDPDMTVYDIRKFFQLAADCNPNIIEVLWTDEADIISQTEIGSRIRWFRNSFLSQKAKYTFSGYAVAQLKRIKTHHNWLLNPVEVKPQRKDFDLPETSVISADIMGAIESLQAATGIGSDTYTLKFGPEVMHAYQRERAYHNAMREWGQYQNWKANRNPKRAEMEARYHYDCKHAMHLVRLMRMCREILIDGKVLVRRPDREELLAIRNGAWTYDQLIEWAERQDAEMDGLLKQSTLRKSPDRVYLDAVCEQMVAEFLDFKPITLARAMNDKDGSRQTIKAQAWIDRLPYAIICDVDGTLALHDGRRGPYDFDKADGDAVNQPIKTMLHGMLTCGQGIRIILVSGREEKWRGMTDRWLLENEILYERFFMRATDDDRPDNEVKKEIYDREIKGKYNVLFVVEDRRRVVDMWRAEGLVCLQCDYGDF